MDMIMEKLAAQLQITVKQVVAVLQLLADGNTVPFIARYRKEMTGGLDEEAIRCIEEQYAYQQHLQKRKEDVQRLIEQQGHMSKEILQALQQADKLAQVEDIYRPYQQKRKTRASEAIAKGLQPLAEWLMKLTPQQVEPQAQRYVQNEVTDVAMALQGAMDILAERIADDPKVRDKTRTHIQKYGKLVTKVKKQHDDIRKVYRMYYDYSERFSTLAGHRIMAIDRGEKAKVLQVSIEYPQDFLFDWIKRRYIYKASPAAAYVEQAMMDGLKRLTFPAVEREIRKELTAKAQEQSIDIFSSNLEHLLLQPPMKNKTILGFDPAFRTGCKLAVIDVSGKLLHIDVIYPHPPKPKRKEAAAKLAALLQQYHVDIIAIGNGTASRESEAFVAEVLRMYHLPVAYAIVSEAGASVYSASPLAKQEFPDLQVEQRSAVSIARRLLDPLSELIKIDPQSIGVGQYQHDLPTARLKERLDFVVVKAVNRVGVNVNTADALLLTKVAGLHAASAKALVSYRSEHGRIRSREELKQVPKIGERSYEQAAGFLRIEDGEEPLDRTSIHPESYALTRQLLALLSLQVTDMGTAKARETIQQVDKAAMCRQLHTDLYTLQDILEAIAQPLRDYRDRYDAPLLRSDVLELEDLHIGDSMEGVVRNVVDFGAFVDIGLHEDGLVHISKLRKERVGHPLEVVSVGDIVKVWVSGIDEEKQKVQLSMLAP